MCGVSLKVGVTSIDDVSKVHSGVRLYDRADAFHLMAKTHVLMNHHIWYKFGEMGATCQGGVITTHLLGGRW
jgi:hypothetical protein